MPGLLRLKQRTDCLNFPFKPEFGLVREAGLFASDAVGTKKKVDNIKQAGSQIIKEQDFADVDLEYLMLRLRFVLAFASTDFRSFKHFGGKLLYVPNKCRYPPSRDDGAYKAVLEIARDIEAGWHLWNFLIHGDVDTQQQTCCCLEGIGGNHR